jgi:uncharacterized protein (TIGR01777 family)
MKIAVTGANGFIGRALCASLATEGHEVVRLVRRRTGLAGEVLWSAERGLDDPTLLDGCDVIVHLAGENIASSLRWTPAKKERIRASRVLGARNLVAALKSLSAPPRAFLSASAVGIYGDRGDEVLTESSAPGQRGFLVEVAKAMEDAAQEAATFGARVVTLRFGIVLGSDGGAFPRLVRLFRFGLGGRLGSGKQWWSWITRDDAVRALMFILQQDQLRGPVNLTAPQPVTNAEFTSTLARAVRRPAFFHAPAFALRLLLGELAEELFLSSARVIPQRLEQAGFEFQDRSLEGALKRLIAKPQ